MPDDKVIPVKVALRCRPLVSKEINEGCQTCLQFIPGEPQVVVGGNKSFTYDFTYHPNTSQAEVFDQTVRPLIEGVFKGYNATVLAYGQTGSGKTFTMGSALETALSEDKEIQGVIPRVIRELFASIQQQAESDFTVKVSYLELYNEELNDLLSACNKKDGVQIREDIQGGIKLAGLEEKEVKTPEDTMFWLEKGSNSRTTGATAMNQASSRSHAVFTIAIEKIKKDDSNDCWISKFHLVDLAGSERAKKTKAQGDRFREGVNINMGLLALGNVISALGDDSQKRGHIPYRDSKLTRLLQDSLGGNSHTTMIACVSPADSNIEETINTLRYADRARKIKNKPIINRDPQAAEIMRLKTLLQQAQMQIIQGGGNLNTSASSSSSPSPDLKVLISRNKKLEQENETLSHELQTAISHSTAMQEKLILSELSHEKLKDKLNIIAQSTKGQSSEDGENEDPAQESLVKELQKTLAEIETEEAKNVSLFQMATELQEEISSAPGSPTTGACTAEHALQQAKLDKELKELNRMLEKKEQLASQMSQNDGKWEAMKASYECSLRDLEQQIDHLNKEKENLSQALHSVKTNTASNKVSEQRRKRLQELETQMATLKRKVLEQTKMLRLKEQSSKEVTKMHSDITAMKQQRVKLIKQMKEDAEGFRKWRSQKDKEVLQLKAKDRKRQFEMTRMSQKHERQQNVLKRKAEEAAAANKRLKDALSKQKMVAEERKGQLNKDMAGIGARVRKWLGQEVEVRVSIEEAKRHLDDLMKDRKEIVQQVQELREKLEGPPRKKYAWMDKSREELDPADQADVRKQIKDLERDLELRNVQITDFQQKLLGADEDGRKKSPWEAIHTMVEAKCALKWLMNTAVTAKALNSKTNSDREDVKANYSEAAQNLEKAQEELRSLTCRHQEELTMMKKQHEDKVLFLLHQLQNSSKAVHDESLEEDTKKRLKFQEAEISKLSTIHEELLKKSEECEQLRKELTLARYKGHRDVSLLPNIIPEGSPFASPKPKKKVKKVEVYEEEYEELEDEEEDYIDSGDEYIPTPFQKRTKRKMVRQSSKSTSLTAGCGCKTDCSSKRCSCNKGALKCSGDCKCDPMVCSNLERETPQSTTSDTDLENGQSTVSSLNATFNIGQLETPSGSTCDSTAMDTTPTGRPSPKRVLAELNAERDSIEDFRDTKGLFQPPTVESSSGGGIKTFDKSKRKRTLLPTSGFFKSPLLPS